MKQAWRQTMKVLSIGGLGLRGPKSAVRRSDTPFPVEDGVGPATVLEPCLSASIRRGGEVYEISTPAQTALGVDPPKSSRNASPATPSPLR